MLIIIIKNSFSLLFALQEPQINTWRKPQRFTTVNKNTYDSVMAAYGVSFESSNSIEERKESKRQARKEALEKVWTVRWT